MVSAHTQSVVGRAKLIYAERLQTEMEAEHRDKFIAVEPDSGDCFLADTFDEAADAARAGHPGRMSHIMRVGHPAALSLGNVCL